VDVVNNVVFDYGWNAGDATDDHGLLQINYVGNRVIGHDKVPELGLSHAGSAHGFSVYVDGNLGPHRTSDTQDQKLVVNREQWHHITATRNPAPAVTTTSAAVAYDQVLSGAGAVFPKRDAVDLRIVDDVKLGRGGLISTPARRAAGRSSHWAPAGGQR